jgi:hypothetical protein
MRVSYRCLPWMTLVCGTPVARPVWQLAPCRDQGRAQAGQARQPVIMGARTGVMSRPAQPLVCVLVRSGFMTFMRSERAALGTVCAGRSFSGEAAGGEQAPG